MRVDQPGCRAEVTVLPYPGRYLTSRFTSRHADGMWSGFLLHGRVHVLYGRVYIDLVRHAGARCPSL